MRSGSLLVTNTLSPDGCFEQLTDRRRLLDNLLEIVQNEQDLLAA